MQNPAERKVFNELRATRRATAAGRIAVWIVGTACAGLMIFLVAAATIKALDAYEAAIVEADL